MKLKLQRPELVEALGLVKTAAAKAGSLPILANVALQATKTALELRCTDLDISVRTQIPATVLEPGDTTVRAGLLHDLLRSLTDDAVTLELRKGQLKLTSKTSEYELAVLEPTEFPPLPKLKNGVVAKVPEAQLYIALHTTRHAIASDESRHVLNGTFLQCNGKLTAVATDGRRIACTAIEVAGLPKAEAILPGRTVAELLRLLDAKGETSVKITLGQNAAEFVLGNVTLHTKLIEGTYPNYRQVIPKDGAAKPVAVPRAELLTCIERVALVSPESCEVEFAGQMLTVRGVGKDVGRACETLLIAPAKTRCLVFNPDYLKDALRATEDAEVLFVSESGEAPCLIKSPTSAWLSVICPQRTADAKAAEAKPEEKTQPAPKADKKETKK